MQIKQRKANRIVIDINKLLKYKNTTHFHRLFLFYIIICYIIKAMRENEGITSEEALKQMYRSGIKASYFAGFRDPKFM